MKLLDLKLGKAAYGKIIVQILTSFQGVWAVLMACWLIPFLASWPGVFVIDNVFQMKWFLGGQVSAHHPILHTYLLGWILKFGKTVFGTYEAGLGIYCILQMFFVGSVFLYDEEAGVICRRTLSDHLRDCVCPDSLSSDIGFYSYKGYHICRFFFLIVLKTFLLVGRQEQFFSSVKEMALYCLFVFLMCAFRNTGIYIFVFSFPAMLVVWRKYWKKMLAVGITCILAWGIYVGPVYGVLHIGKGSSAEMLSVPMQQLARVMVYAPDELTEEEKADIEMYMPDYMRYEPPGRRPGKRYLPGRTV